MTCVYPLLFIYFISFLSIPTTEQILLGNTQPEPKSLLQSRSPERIPAQLAQQQQLQTVLPSSSSDENNHTVSN